MMRFEGPIARQNQHLFASDWMAQVNEDSADLLRRAAAAPASRASPAQVIGTGPTVRYSAMPEVFESLMYAARRELVITTPYYVPDEVDAGGALRQRPPRRRRRRSSSRRGTTRGSSPRPAAATTPTCSPPGSGSSSTRAACCTPSR